MKLFDVNICLGKPVRGLPEPGISREDILHMMDDAGIEKGLAWHIAQHDSSTQAGNALISEALAGCDRLLGCWSILPPQTDEVICDRFFEKMAAERIVALRAMPEQHFYLLNRVVFGGFLDELSQRGIPLMISLAYGSSWNTVYTLMADYPELTCIVCDTGVWSQSRFIYPLLEKYPRVMVDTSMYSITASAIEDGVKRYGAQRFVFGSGYPARYPEAASLDLRHSAITETDRQLIAYGNMQRVIEEEQL